MNNAKIVVAAEEGREMEVRSLLAAGASVESMDGLGQTALMAAASKNYVGVMKILVEHGADVNMNNLRSSGFGILHYASKGITEISVLKCLLYAGADPNIRNANGGRTPLMTASSFGMIESARVLLNGGADIYAQAPSYTWTYGNQGTVTALDVARNKPMRRFLRGEMDRRTAAVLSVLPYELPKEVWKSILELTRKRKVGCFP